MMEIHGKIYVVVMVVAILFTGIAMFLFYLDRMEKKIDSLENKNETITSDYKKYSA
jgi:Tfp pilus assembly protein PilO